MGVSTRAFLGTICGLINGESSALGLCQLVLYKNPVSLGADTVLADLELCDFDGYTSAGLSGNGAVYNPLRMRWEVVMPSQSYICTGNTTPNVVYGWALLNDDSDTLRYAENFDSPIPINDAGDGLVVEPVYTYGT
jgi:hypothetical protein